MGWTELYAVGFNAWSQALFKLTSRLGNEPHDVNVSEEPNDLHKFTRVLDGRSGDIKDVQASLSYTMVTTTAGTNIYGLPSPEQRILRTLPKRASYRLIAEADNGKVTILDHAGNLRMYETSRTALQNEEDCALFPGFSDVTQLVAYEVGFAALDRNGRVWTWGDERFALCLGRGVATASSAHRPGQVTDLDGLPTGRIVKIAANGYVLAGLTDGGDLYCWGGHPAQAPIIDGLDGIPNLVDIDGKDVADVAVGDSHMMVLTAEDHRVMVIGNNSNGQLGIAAENAATWAEVPLGLGEESRIKAVRAGPKTSFVIVENDREEAEISGTKAEDERKDGASISPDVSEDVELAGALTCS